jgi:phosphatidylinositol-3,4,5-trisphosphate 3-phosphatase/dual-specificity protein phosphatase PTEN
VDNVVVINCRAGKGRTGTIICCYLLFSKRFDDAEEAMQYYSKKRFSTGEGVTQPSQKRYVHYFAQLLKEKIYFPLVRTLKAISVHKLIKKNSETIKPYFEIYLGNGEKLFYTSKTSYLDQKKIFSNNTDLITITDSNFGILVAGDLTIKLYNHGMLSSKKLGRIAFNTAFLENDQNILTFKVEQIDPDNLARKKKVPKEYEIRLKFGALCDCSNLKENFKLCNTCSEILINELSDWKEIRNIIEVRLI